MSNSFGLLKSFCYTEIMKLKRKRVTVFLIWLTVILIPWVYIISTTSVNLLFSNNLVLLNVFQRITGLTAFSLLFFQIMLGACMDRWIQILGARAYRAHIFQGIISYGFVLIHPIFYFVISFEASGILPWLPDLSTYQGVGLTYARIAFFLITLSVIASYFRTQPFFRRNWRAFHMINYFSFFLVAMHAYRVGSDIKTIPFSIIFWVYVLIVSLTVLFKINIYLRSALKGRTLQAKVRP